MGYYRIHLTAFCMDFSTILLYTSIFCGLYFQIFLLVTFFESDEKKKPVAKNKSVIAAALPTVSIIVPCWNESKTVERTLISLLNLEYPKEKLSVLVVDDGSKDDTYTVALNAAVQLCDNERLPSVVGAASLHFGPAALRQRQCVFGTTEVSRSFYCLSVRRRDECIQAYVYAHNRAGLW